MCLGAVGGAGGATEFPPEPGEAGPPGLECGAGGSQSYTKGQPFHLREHLFTNTHCNVMIFSYLHRKVHHVGIFMTKSYLDIKGGKIDSFKLKM